ncbi:MAG: hypothetical protein JXQ99_03890 [Hyphomicrobiaceae bacterium]
MRSFQYCLVGVVTLAGVACSATLTPELQKAKAAKRPIFVGNLYAQKAQQRGHIDANAQFFNTSNKTYKYVELHVTATNRVGDPIMREGDNSATVRLQFTGPLRPRRSPGISTWPNIWYLQKPFCLKVLKIDITHIDGSSVSLDGATLEDVLSKKLRKDCRTRVSALRG